MNISERRKLLEIIKTATTGKDATFDEIMEIAILQGYARMTLQKYLNELSSHTFLNRKVIAKGDKFTDDKISYRWSE